MELERGYLGYMSYGFPLGMIYVFMSDLSKSDLRL